MDAPVSTPPPASKDFSSMSATLLINDAQFTALDVAYIDKRIVSISSPLNISFWATGGLKLGLVVRVFNESTQVVSTKTYLSQHHVYELDPSLYGQPMAVLHIYMALVVDHPMGNIYPTKLWNLTFERYDSIYDRQYCWLTDMFCESFQTDPDVDKNEFVTSITNAAEYTYNQLEAAGSDLSMGDIAQHIIDYMVYTVSAQKQSHHAPIPIPAPRRHTHWRRNTRGVYW